MKLTLYIVSEHQQGLMRLIEHWRGLWRNKEVESEVEPPLGTDEDPFDEPVVMEIRDVIDLHAIPPKQVKAVVEEYLIEARARRFSYVRIIHGKGIGAQRAMVRKILGRAPFVIRYYDAPPEAGGLGATIAELDIEKHG
jgi:dsDNA-specific endonuclease/ATPase MutS2